MSVLVGSRPRVSFAFWDREGANEDPDAVTVVVLEPGGTSHTYTLAGATVTREVIASGDLELIEKDAFPKRIRSLSYADLAVLYPDGVITFYVDIDTTDKAGVWKVRCTTPTGEGQTAIEKRVVVDPSEVV